MIFVHPSLPSFVLFFTWIFNLWSSNLQSRQAQPSQKKPRDVTVGRNRFRGSYETLPPTPSTRLHGGGGRIRKLERNLSVFWFIFSNRGHPLQSWIRRLFPLVGLLPSTRFTRIPSPLAARGLRIRLHPWHECGGLPRGFVSVPSSFLPFTFGNSGVKLGAEAEILLNHDSQEPVRLIHKCFQHGWSPLHPAADHKSPTSYILLHAGPLSSEPVLLESVSRQPSLRLGEGFLIQGSIPSFWLSRLPSSRPKDVLTLGSGLWPTSSNSGRRIRPWLIPLDCDIPSTRARSVSPDFDPVCPLADEILPSCLTEPHRAADGNGSGGGYHRILCAMSSSCLFSSPCYGGDTWGAASRLNYPVKYLRRSQRLSCLFAGAHRTTCLVALSASLPATNSVPEHLRFSLGYAHPAKESRVSS